MSRNDTVHRTVVRNVNLTAKQAESAEKHNERKKGSYANADIVAERTLLNVYYKHPNGSYSDMYAKMIESGELTERGQKVNANKFCELIYDVNTAYFESHGGYAFAAEFFGEAYKSAVETVGDERYIMSAAMHADEINRSLSDAMGRNIYHYHLHVVYIPVVAKDILHTKRCKDKSLIGTVKKTVMQVSASKKWMSKPELDENGQPKRTKSGKVILCRSYAKLQDDFFEHMKKAGYDDLSLGETGSQEEHLTVIRFKVMKENERLITLQKACDALDAAYDARANDMQVLQEEISYLEYEKDSAEEKYTKACDRISKAESFVNDLIENGDEVIPQPSVGESSKDYRQNKVKPFFKKIVVLARSLYLICLDLLKAISELQSKLSAEERRREKAENEAMALSHENETLKEKALNLDYCLRYYGEKDIEYVVALGRADAENELIPDDDTR